MERSWADLIGEAMGYSANNAEIYSIKPHFPLAIPAETAQLRSIGKWKGNKEMTSNIGNPKFSAAQAHFEAACKASRDHSALGRKAFAEHGDGNGVQISG